MRRQPAPPPPGGSPPGPVRALVVDDSCIDCMVAGGLVQQGLGWQVTRAEDGARALAAMERQTPDIVLTDLVMPEMDGLELVQGIRRRFPLVPVVLMTAHGSEEI